MKLRILASAIWLCCLSGLGFAQQAGVKDLTVVDSHVPAEHVPGPSIGECPTVNSGITNPARKPDVGRTTANDSLELSVNKVSALHVGEPFTATVRLKNLGSSTVMVPWETDGERVTRISESGQEENYEATDIALILKSADAKQKIMWLEGGGALFAHPDIKTSYLEIPAGQWVDVKVKGTLSCAHEDLPCAKIKPDPHGLITAWWYQRELTHQVHDCNDDHGNTVIRELDSKELPVVVHAAAAPAKSSANK
jgi:hypothetical protein